MMDEENDAFYSPPAPDGLDTMEMEKPKVKWHYIALLVHLLFKILALLTYLFASLIFSNQNFVIPFIISVIFLALDFWITKNITGRLLVGMRWWNEVKEDGTNVWIFESLENETLIHPVEKKVFWISMFAFLITWFAFLIKQIFDPSQWNWAILCGIALVLGAANVTGYIKCARDARKKVKKMATQWAVEKAVNQAWSK